MNNLAKGVLPVDEQVLATLASANTLIFSIVTHGEEQMGVTIDQMMEKLEAITGGISGEVEEGTASTKNISKAFPLGEPPKEASVGKDENKKLRLHPHRSSNCPLAFMRCRLWHDAGISQFKHLS